MIRQAETRRRLLLFVTKTGAAENIVRRAETSRRPAVLSAKTGGG